MKLESLHIKNYKLFKDLEIPKLGQVNLITGKNNTGKTILLEALRIWASAREDSEVISSVINNIIWSRGDWDPSSNLKSFSSLFYEKKISRVYALTNLDYQFDKGEIFINKIQIVVNEDISKKLNFYIREKGSRLEDDVLINFWRFDRGNKEYPQDKAIFVPASIDTKNFNLWEKIYLRPKEEMVVRILQTIEPKIVKIGITPQGNALVTLKDSTEPVPLKNFGEGLNRLLTIAMALVSAEDNLLLIDEIDTGLHYSVLEKLWEIIFKYAGELNAQVFVTTHSGDCVEAYTTVANQERFAGLSNYFRLQWTRDNQRIVPVMYKQKDLEIAVEQDIETR